MKFLMKKLYEDQILRARTKFLWFPLEMEEKNGIYWHWFKWITVCERYDRTFQRWSVLHKIMGKNLDYYAEAVKLYNNTKETYDIFKRIDENGKCVVDDFTTKPYKKTISE